MSDFVNYNPIIFEVKLENLEGMSKVVLCHALTRFVPEVTKVKDRSEYPEKTLYKMIIAIQKHINKKGLTWKLIDDPEFKEVKVVLDNVVKQRAEVNIRMVKKQVAYIPIEIENELWSQVF